MSDLYTTKSDVLSTPAPSIRPPRRTPSPSPSPILMPSRISLESLPLEVIHQIFALLPPPALTTLRLTSLSLLHSATSNPHWRTHFTRLLPLHSALIDIASIPPTAWSFSLVPDGWFRAYCMLQKTARCEWLQTEEQLKGSTWMVFFKAFLKEGGARGEVGDGAPHATVELRGDLHCHPVEGLPLGVSKWSVERRSLRFSGYPPNMPSRDPYTWCRVMQHVSVLMLSDAPEFLTALVALNTQILTETGLSPESTCLRQDDLDAAVADVLETRRINFCERLRKLHVERSGCMERWDEESDWSQDESEDEEGWSEGEERSLDGCVLFQRFKEMREGVRTGCGEEGGVEAAGEERATECGQ